MNRRELSFVDIYSLLPRTDCKECSEQKCLTLAAKLVDREATLEKCPQLLIREDEEA